MATQLSFFDMSVSVTPPNGHMEPVPVQVGPNWQPNDVRLLLVSAAGKSSDVGMEIPMSPDPPTGFTAAYSANLGIETRGVYYRYLQAGDNDVSVAWPKPSGWQHYFFAMMTVRGVSPTTQPAAGQVTVTQTGGDTTATASSVSVPNAGTMVFWVGNIPTPWPGSGTPWAVSMGAPSGWTNLVATEKSGSTFFQYGTDTSLIVVGKSYSSSGSTGTVSFPTAQGFPAFAGLYVFLTPAADVSATIGAA